MQIIQDFRAFDKYFPRNGSYKKTPFMRDPSVIDTIIIHATAGICSVDWMVGGEKAAKYVRGIGMFHFLNKLDGTLTAVIPENFWCFHSDREINDVTTIGIENENPKPYNAGQFTPAQYQSLNWLIFEYLMPKYPRINIIQSHDRAYQKYASHLPQPKPVPCPGPNFNWGIIENGLTSHGYQYDRSQLPVCPSYWNIKHR